MYNVSIIIPVYNDDLFIAQCINSLQKQTYPTKLYEIIIIDNGSTDKTSEIIKSFEGITYIYQENQGPSSARNRGLSLANKDYALFSDAFIFSIETVLLFCVGFYRRLYKRHDKIF